MLGGAAALRYRVGVAVRPRTRRLGWGRAARPWLHLAPALLVHGRFWLGPSAYSLQLWFFDWDMARPVHRSFTRGSSGCNTPPVASSAT